MSTPADTERPAAAPDGFDELIHAPVRLRLTDTGRAAYRGHVAALHRIVGDSPG